MSLEGKKTPKKAFLGPYKKNENEMLIFQFCLLITNYLKFLKI